NIVYNVLYRLFGIDGMFLISKSLFCFMALFLLFRIFLLLIKDRTLATIAAAITLFEANMLSKIIGLAYASNLTDAIITLAPINTYAFRLYQMSFSLIPLLIFIYILIRFVQTAPRQESASKLLWLVFIAAVNVYIYVFNWMVLTAIMGTVYIWHLYLHWKNKDISKAIKELAHNILLYCLIISPFFYVSLTYTQISLQRFGLISEHLIIWEAAIGYGLALIISLILAKLLRTRKSLGSRVHNLFVTLLILMFAFSNVTMITGFSIQPLHFIRYFEYFFLILLMSGLLLLLRARLGAMIGVFRTRRLLKGPASLAIVTFVLLIILVHTTVYALNSTTMQRVRPMDPDLREVLDYIDANAKGDVVLSFDPVLNPLITIYTDSFLFLPNAYLTNTQINETLDRFAYATHEVGIPPDVAISAFLSPKEGYSLPFYLFHFHYPVNSTRLRGPDDAAIEHIKSAYNNKDSQNALLRSVADFDHFLVSPLEAKALNSMPENFETVFSNDKYTLLQKKNPAKPIRKLYKPE
ncbi:hypothetical protein KY362_08050, partial [Candidatus Woesearchaeota archaeon]|nr:hypothetical protein [Candidatus Woesearchaeota archaeon]